MDLKTNGSNVGSNNNSLTNNNEEAFGSQIVLREMEDDMLLEPVSTGQIIHVGTYPNSPITAVKQILQQKAAGDYVDPHPIFCEMLELSTSIGDENAEYSWAETARWIKFEETVEEGGKRWSKPKISLLTLPGLLQTRNCLRKGISAMDVQVDNFAELVDMLIGKWAYDHKIVSEAESAALREALLSPKQHLLKSGFRDRERMESATLLDVPGKKNGTEEDVSDVSDTEANQTTITSLRGRDLAKRLRMKSGDPNKANLAKDRLMKKIKPESEAAVILIGKLYEICEPLAAFVRLKKPVVFQDIPEIPIPSRFAFFLIVPSDHTDRDIEMIGKCFGVLFTDGVFSSLAYNAKDCTELAYGIDEFLSQTIVIPSGKWSLDARLDPNQGALVNRQIGGPLKRAISIAHGHHMDPGLSRTGRIFGGLAQDVRRKARVYLSDFTDAFRVTTFTQCLAAAIFLFFANITKIITFGGVMESMLHKNMAAMENLLSGGICGVIYALFSGQPLAVLSATGPTLVFEAILFKFCQSQEWTFLPTRFWVGVWTAVLILILTALDASVIVSLITKFTEEAFATLISAIFIIQAFEELLHLQNHAPITPANQLKLVMSDPCLCNVTDISLNVTMARKERFDSSLFSNVTGVFTDYTKEGCLAIGGYAEGRQCDFHPDVFPFSCVLFILTFLIAYGLKLFRHSGYLPSRLRDTVSDFGVLIAIVLMTLLNSYVGLDVQSLNVPEKFEPTIPRPWFINPMDVSAWWIPLVAIVPALFFTILVVMDQQITSVIVNRKENKLKKGFGYHLDIFIIAILMVICSWMGIPYYVAATVISIMHVESLRTMTETAAPGEKPQMLGVREQRVTALIAHILIGLAVFLTPVIKLVPVPVLLGIFLYTGIVALSGQQFAQRVALFFMPVKYQPDYNFLRLVPLRRVHLFTVIQIGSLLLLFVVKYVKSISMFFPVMLIFMVIVRKLLDRVFSQQELLALDDPLPTWKEMMAAHREGKMPKGPKMSIVDSELGVQQRKKLLGAAGDK